MVTLLVGSEYLRVPTWTQCIDKFKWVSFILLDDLKSKLLFTSFYLRAPTNIPLHSISRPYGPNKQYLMNEMPIQCPWEPDGVVFLGWQS
jgi:hypothetical protein